jgi:NAD(P)-dependent dehydrogenase (short-subunit alcohol dehydrogenase family)
VTTAESPTAEFVSVMVTNALSPMRVVELLQDLVVHDGLIGIMSSGQGSITNNAGGGQDTYRASKAALNMLMQSYAARHAAEPRALVLLAPGWIRTELGGAHAPITVEDAMPQVMSALLAQRGKPGLHYVDRNGQTVPW